MDVVGPLLAERQQRRAVQVVIVGGQGAIDKVRNNWVDVEPWVLCLPPPARVHPKNRRSVILRAGGPRLISI